MNLTETRNEKTKHIDKMSTLDMLTVINQEDATVIRAVEAELPQIAKAVEAIVEGLNKGGRLIYIGAGTSGRLAVIDAAECPPTYGVSPELVQGIIAGGVKTMMRASENEEDNKEKGIEEMQIRNITKNDVVVGISASGGASYVLGALEEAKRVGCVTVGISNNKGCPIDKFADISICPQTGPEVVTGSTRMKAGTSQKLVLNMLSTCSMIKTGKVYENLMINLKPTNIKLRGRVISIVCDILSCDEEKAVELLEKHNWSIRDVVDNEI